MTKRVSLNDNLIRAIFCCVELFIRALSCLFFDLERSRRKAWALRQIGGDESIRMYGDRFCLRAASGSVRVRYQGGRMMMISLLSDER